MGLVTAITAATAIGGALIQSSANKKAAKTVAKSADQQIALDREIYNDQKRLAQPFYDTGVAANKAAAELLGLNVPGAQGYGQTYNGTNRYRGYQPQFTQKGGDNALSQFASAPIDYRAGGIGGTRFAPQRKLIKGPVVNGGSRSLGGRGTGAGYNPLRDRRTETSNGRPLYRNQQLNTLVQSPGYQFRLQEGIKALDQSAAVKGGLLSGAHLKHVTGYAQDYAAREYGNRLAQLNTQITGGQRAGNTVSDAGTNFGSSAGTAISNAGAAQAGLAAQRGSIYGTALGTVGGAIAGWGKDNKGWT